MRRMITQFAAVLMVALSVTACKKDAKQAEAPKDEISQETLGQIKSLGFGTSNVRKTSDGYLVEGDILLTPEFLSSSNNSNFLRVANEEQYRTFNVVTGLPRTVTIGTTGLGQAYIDGAKLAISRYNALGLGLKFQFVTNGRPDIMIRGFNEGPSGGYITLGSAGFSNQKWEPIPRNSNEYQPICIWIKSRCQLCRFRYSTRIGSLHWLPPY